METKVATFAPPMHSPISLNPNDPGSCLLQLSGSL